MQKKQWLSSEFVTNAEKDKIINMGQDMSAFEGLINFGTAGMRGVMEPGSNRINRFTIAQISRALALHMKNNKQNRIVIACDTRNNSEYFKNLSATIFSLYGFEVFVFDKLIPISVISYAIRELCCDFGIYITASHNPKEYNGYKVFDNTGCQITEGTAELISSLRSGVDLLSKIPDIENNFNIIDHSLLDSFYYNLKSYTSKSNKNIDITYTGLFGVGNNIVDDFLRDLGYTIHTVKSQKEYNGDFPGLNGPNPENEDAFDEALKTANEYNSDIIIATDPDADRLGVMVYHNNKYVRLSGNQVGILLTDYMIKKNKINNVCVIKSDVSTKMVDAICIKNNIPLISVPTGFKNIGTKINENKHNFLFGFEESCGYLIGDYARDKDSVGAAMIISEMAANYKDKNKTLIDRLNELYDEYGYFLENTLSISITEEISIFDFVDMFRKHNISIKNLHGKGNLLEINTFDKTSLIIRKSGTEPKMKIYIKTFSKDKEEAHKLMLFYSEIISKFKI